MEVTRRKFLKSMATGVGAMSLGSVAASQAFAFDLGGPVGSAQPQLALLEKQLDSSALFKNGVSRYVSGFLEISLDQVVPFFDSLSGAGGQRPVILGLGSSAMSTVTSVIAQQHKYKLVWSGLHTSAAGEVSHQLRGSEEMVSQVSAAINHSDQEWMSTLGESLSGLMLSPEQRHLSPVDRKVYSQTEASTQVPTYLYSWIYAPVQSV